MKTSELELLPFEEFLQVSAEIRQRLHEKLIEIYLSPEKIKFFDLWPVNDLPFVFGDAQIVNLILNNNEHHINLDNLKFAVNKWCSIYHNDRLFIIDSFICLFSRHLVDRPAFQKALMFSRIFIYEFSSILV